MNGEEPIGDARHDDQHNKKERRAPGTIPKDNEWPAVERACKEHFSERSFRYRAALKTCFQLGHYQHFNEVFQHEQVDNDCIRNEGHERKPSRSCWQVPGHARHTRPGCSMS